MLGKSTDILKRFTEKYGIGNTRKCVPIVFLRDYTAKNFGLDYQIKSGTVGVIDSLRAEGDNRFKLCILMYVRDVPGMESTVTIPISFEGVVTDKEFSVTECKTNEDFDSLFSVVDEEAELTKTMTKLCDTTRSYMRKSNTYEHNVASLAILSIVLPMIILTVAALVLPSKLYTIAVLAGVVGLIAILITVVTSIAIDREAICYERSLAGKYKINKIKKLTHKIHSAKTGE